MALLTASLKAWLAKPHPLDGQLGGEALAAVTENYPEGTPLSEMTWDQWAQRLAIAASGERVTPVTAMRVPSVSASIRRLSDAGGRLPVKVVDEDGMKVPFQPPWTTANPCEGVTEFHWKKMTLTDYMGPGYVVWAIESWMHGLPWHLRPLPARYARVSSVNGRLRVTWSPSYRQTRQTKIMETWRGPGHRGTNLCIVDYFHDDWTYNGRSPLLSDLRDIIGLGLAVLRHSGVFFRNGGTPMNIVSMNEAGTNERQAAESLQTMIDDHQDDVDRRQSVMVVGAPLATHKLAYSPVEAQMIEVMDRVDRAVAGYYGIDPTLLGMTGTAYGKADAEKRKDIYRSALPPWTDRYEAALNRTLPPGQRVVFDTSDVLRGDLEVESKGLTTASGGPYMTVGEARDRAKLPADYDEDDLRDPPPSVEIVANGPAEQPPTG